MTWKKHTKSGQGLLEVIVALAIIVSGIIGMLSLALANQNASGETLTRLVAVNLAREALEVARRERDGNWLAGSAWDEGLSDGNDYTAALFFDPSSNTWTMEFSADDIDDELSKVWLLAAVYRQGDFSNPPENIEQTSYRRLLSLDLICAAGNIITSGSACPDEAVGRRLSARVDWNFKGKEKSLILEERIYDWR